MCFRNTNYLVCEAKMPIKAVWDRTRGTFKGSVQFARFPVEVTEEILVLSMGLYWFHVHQFRDNLNGCISAGGHFNLHNKDHGGSDHEVKHVDDLGNFTAGDDGADKIYFKTVRINKMCLPLMEK